MEGRGARRVERLYPFFAGNVPLPDKRNESLAGAVRLFLCRLMAGSVCDRGPKKAGETSSSGQAGNSEYR